MGADLGTPVELPQGQNTVDEALATYGPAGATGTIHYSSWAQLGDAIEAVAGVSAPQPGQRDRDEPPMAALGGVASGGKRVEAVAGEFRWRDVIANDAGLCRLP